VTFRATLLSMNDQGNDQLAHVSRLNQTVVIDETTDTVTLAMPAYAPERTTRYVGLVYASDAKPLAEARFSLVDDHSGAAFATPDGTGNLATDERGIYTFRYLAAVDAIRLRTGAGPSTRDVVVKPGAALEEGWRALPFVNLNGSQTAPFAVNLGLLRGAKGDKGDKGDRGDAGAATRISQEVIAAGSAECPTGGVRISSWQQAPGTTSDVFDASRGSSNLSQRTLCNGANGAGGGAGARLFAGSVDVGNFAGGVIPYLGLDGAYLTLVEGSSPATFQPLMDRPNIDAPRAQYASVNCSGAPFVSDGWGRAARTLSSYVVAADTATAGVERDLLSEFQILPNGTPACVRLNGLGSLHRLGNFIATEFQGRLSRSLDGTAFTSAPFDGSVHSTATNTAGTSLIALQDGTMLKSVDGGASFTPITPPADASGIQVDLHAEGTTFYASGNYGDAGLWKSPDAGATWSLVSGDTWGNPSIIGSRAYFQDSQQFLDLTDGRWTRTSSPCERDLPWTTAGVSRCLTRNNQSTDGVELWESTDGSATRWKKRTDVTPPSRTHNS
jgi:hypothetical protein